ncbi:hypothetical protein MRX96_035680 [Rhipicephalus microplus]
MRAHAEERNEIPKPAPAKRETSAWEGGRARAVADSGRQSGGSRRLPPGDAIDRETVATAPLHGMPSSGCVGHPQTRPRFFPSFFFNACINASSHLSWYASVFALYFGP